MRLSDLPIIEFLFFAIGALAVIVANRKLKKRRTREIVDIRASRRVYRMSHLCCFGLVLERLQECSEFRAQPKITRRKRTQEP